MDPTKQRRGGRLGFARTAPEVRVRCEGIVGKQEIIRDHTQEMRGVLRPAGHPQVDLAHGSEAVAVEERG